MKEVFYEDIQVSVELRLPRPESPPPSLLDSFNSLRTKGIVSYSSLARVNLRV